MEIITGAINWFTVHLPLILEVIGAFAVLATITPNKADDEIIGTLLKAVNFLGANFGKAKNGE